MRQSMIFGTLYTLFLLWQNRWFSQPLSEAEVDAYLDKMAQGGKHETPLQDKELANARAFFLADDGKPFYMVNLMQYRETAVYPHGIHPEVKTGREANALYSKAVVKELLKRGSYPIFLSRKTADLFSAGEGTDFFEEVGIVRYRSRRDMLEMASSPSFQAAEPHKWASMEKTVVVPTRKILLLDPTVIVPMLLLLVGAIRNLKK
ncbi:MAG: hypothetical protein GY943_30660 [Chloroflexi bacterium]|nr:hypothetical protein [Chloroflexota bacterium]